MDINYFLFLRRKYNKILEHIDFINSELDEIKTSIETFINDNDKCINNEEKEHIEVLTYNKLNYDIRKKYYILSIRDTLNQQIKNMCNHEFETDTIDINPDESRTISYCKICEFTLP
jgi:hypothetical protein